MHPRRDLRSRVFRAFLLRRSQEKPVVSIEKARRGQFDLSLFLGFPYDSLWLVIASVLGGLGADMGLCACARGSGLGVPGRRRLSSGVAPP